MSSEDGKEDETQKNLQNVEYENENEQLDRLEIKNSENSDEDDFTEERSPPEPPPDQTSTSGLLKTQKNIIEYHEITMRKINYAYIATNKGEPRDVGSILLENYGKLPNFKNLQKEIVKKSGKEN